MPHLHTTSSQIFPTLWSIIIYKPQFLSIYPVLYTVALSFFPPSLICHMFVLVAITLWTPGVTVKGIFDIYKSPTGKVNAVVPSLGHKPSTQMVFLICMPPRPPHCLKHLYWEEKVNCFSVCPFERPPEAAQGSKSRHVRTRYAPSSPIKDTSPAAHPGVWDGLCNSNICWL